MWSNLHSLNQRGNLSNNNQQFDFSILDDYFFLHSLPELSTYFLNLVVSHVSLLIDLQSGTSTDQKLVGWYKSGADWNQGRSWRSKEIPRANDGNDQESYHSSEFQRKIVAHPDQRIFLQPPQKWHQCNPWQLKGEEITLKKSSLSLTYRLS